MKFSSSVTIALVGTSAAPALAGSYLNSSIINSTVTNSSSPSSMYQLSSDSQMAFYLVERLSLANGGGAATGEILRAASQITPGDFESFYAEFKFLADAIHKLGVSSRSPIARREAFFRSAAYYRSADFFLHGNWSDPRIGSLWDNQLADFDAAVAELKPAPGRRFNVTADNFTVPVIFYSPQEEGSNLTLPTVLAGSGYDGPQEDLYHAIGRYVLERGWNFVTYEGPGQSTVRRQQGLGFRPDWWTVVTPVVDFLVARDDVDATRLALEGVSFGATLAPLAASREARFAALLMIDGLYDLREGIFEQFPDSLVKLFDYGNATLFDYYVNKARAEAADEGVNSNFRWVFDQGTWAFKETSPFRFLTDLGEYNLDGILGNISSPVFVGSGGDDSTAPGQPEEIAEILGDQAYYWHFFAELGAGEHCQLGAEQQLAMATLDWLEGVFEAVGSGKNATDEL